LTQEPGARQEAGDFAVVLPLQSAAAPRPESWGWPTHGPEVWRRRLGQTSLQREAGAANARRLRRTGAEERPQNRGARLGKEIYTAPADPLFLFFCSLLWHREGDASAGWELVHFLRSWDHSARTMAAALLAKTDKAHFSVRDVRRARNGFHVPGRRATNQSKGGSSGEAASMKTPYRLEVIENCLACKLRRNSWFCGFSPEVLTGFSAASHPSTYPAGALLFVEGQVPRGAFVLCSGKVKLSTTSRDGKVLILKVAEAGDVLGLSAAISRTPYEVTAETTTPCQVNFVEREGLLKLMEKSGELGLHAAVVLSHEFQSAYRDIHELVLTRSSAGKLARLLLSRTPGRAIPECSSGEAAEEIRIRSTLTHEEMAQMIGASRETVTRLLSDLKKKELIRLEGPVLVIRNRMALEALAS